MTRVRSATRRAFWRVAAPRRGRELASRVRELDGGDAKRWYYPIDFGYGVEVRPDLRDDPYHGERNWAFLAAHLGPFAGKRVLDIGCNAGLYDLAMLDLGAAEVVGLDMDVAQAEFVRTWFAERRDRDYSRARFVTGDAASTDMAALGRFDLACLFCVAYHLAEHADTVVAQLATTTRTLALQGNLPRLTNPKYTQRTHQWLAGIDGMSDLVREHGFTEIDVVAPAGHPKPLVIARRPTVD